MRIYKMFATRSAALRAACLFALATGATAIAPIAISAAPQGAQPATGPTKEGALATVREMARALRENDADGIARLLSDDWAVISARGGVGEGKSIFPDAIRSGELTRTAFEISEPRVRLYGDVALVTTKVRTAGTFGGKPFDVGERETDVLHWEEGGWKIVLTHETFEGPRSAAQRDAEHAFVYLCIARQSPATGQAGLAGVSTDFKL